MLSCSRGPTRPSCILMSAEANGRGGPELSQSWRPGEGLAKPPAGESLPPMQLTRAEMIHPCNAIKYMHIPAAEADATHAQMPPNQETTQTDSSDSTGRLPADNNEPLSVCVERTYISSAVQLNVEAGKKEIFYSVNLNDNGGHLCRALQALCPALGFVFT